MAQKQIGHTQINHDVMNGIISCGLNGTEISVLLFILRKTDGFHKIDDTISLSQFLAYIPVSRPSLCKALKTLQLVKIIKLVKKGNSISMANTYSFNKNLNEWQLVKKTKLVKFSNRTSKDFEHQLVKKTLPTKETFTKETIQKKVLSEFDTFWKMYPNKKGRAVAERCWSKLSANEKTLALEALPKHCECDQWKKDAGQFIPHPATWLNQKRWEDEITETQQTNSPLLGKSITF